MLRRPTRSTHFPYTTLFRSRSRPTAPIQRSSRSSKARSAPSDRSPPAPVEDLDEFVDLAAALADRKSTRLNSSHGYISYAVFCLKKKKRNVSITNLLCGEVR